MKVRWNRGSVRLRISPGELSALEQGGPVTEDLPLPGGGRWTMSIHPLPCETTLASTEGVLVLSLSADDLERLRAPDAEGVYFQSEDEPALRYCIEKDFPCVHPRAAEAQEPPGETFTAPAGFEARKTEPQ